MSTRTTLTTIVCMLLCSASIQAGGKLSWKADLSGGMHFGETKYNLKFLYPNEVDHHGASELIFPLDAAVAGVNLTGVLTKDRVEDWTFGAYLNMSATDPGDPFTDRDWDIYFNQLEQDYSYTESNVDLKMMEFGGEVTKLLVTSPQIDLWLKVGARYQDIEHEALDYEGYQIVSTDTASYIFPTSYDKKSLTYDVSYFRPYLGFMPRFKIGPRAVVDVLVSGGPVRISDTDNHLLRFFESKSSGWGFGGEAHAEVRYVFASDNPERRPFVSLFGEFAHMGGDLEETRTWYGDDPVTPDPSDDETGRTFTGLSHKVRSTQYRIGVKLGVAFQGGL